MSRVELIAHRGSSYIAPENTLASFRLGWKETTTCELDVQATRDGKLVVIHDDSTKRTTGVDSKVAAFSLSELQQLSAGAFKGEQWKEEKLPSLEEVIAAMPDKKKLLIEIKSGPEIIPELARVVHASGKEKQIVLQSFHADICASAKKALPGTIVHRLFTCRLDVETKSWSPTIDDAITLAKKSGLDGVGINDNPLIDASAVEKIHEAGLKINIWTVDEVDAARRLIALGIDGLITNRPGWLKAQLGESLP